MPYELETTAKQTPIFLHKCPARGGHTTEDNSWTVALGKNARNARNVQMFGLMSKKHPGAMTYMAFIVSTPAPGLRTRALTMPAPGLRICGPTETFVPFRDQVHHTRTHGDRFYFSRSRITSHIWATSDELERVFRAFDLIEETEEEATLRQHLVVEHGVTLPTTTPVRELAGRHAEVHSAQAKEWVC